MATLLVKATGATIPLTGNDGTVIDIDSGVGADLTTNHLSTEAFQGHFAAGELVFDLAPTLDAGQVLLARQISDELLDALATTSISQHQLLDKVMTSLTVSRDAYNVKRAATELIVVASQAHRSGTINLFDSVDHYLAEGLIDTAMTALNAEILAHAITAPASEDDPAYPAWEEEHQRLDALKVELLSEQVRAPLYAAENADMLSALDTAHTDVEAKLDATTASNNVGTDITWATEWTP